MACHSIVAYSLRRATGLPCPGDAPLPVPACPDTQAGKACTVDRIPASGIFPSASSPGPQEPTGHAGDRGVQCPSSEADFVVLPMAAVGQNQQTARQPCQQASPFHTPQPPVFSFIRCFLKKSMVWRMDRVSFSPDQPCPSPSMVTRVTSAPTSLKADSSLVDWL